MARTAEKVRELVSEDPEMRAALTALLEHEDETVEWRDVKGELTSGQWGRLIEKGILTEAGDGFRVDDPEAVREGLSGEDESPTASTSTSASTDADDDEGSSWTTYDKLAGVVAVAMMAGYYYHPIRRVVGGVVDVVLGPIDAMLPFFVVIMILATFTGFYTSIIQANLMDFEKMSMYQEQMQEIQDRQKAAKERGDEEALERIREEQMEAMGDQLGMFKMQFRPMVWIMLLTIPVFLWMYWKLLTNGVTGGEASFVMPLVGQIHLLDRIAGFMPAWIVWYFLCSMGFSQVVRKGLGIQTTPT
ncbi:DUF106 domain-containing protein [Halarchaeum sp. CBA1220]|uniref:DUF106 domain-containing protein n=1 Tax=Halarchaeum sp. CBA1220 TaxID=1853682 RepID=UPI000F3A9415|nr:DUF106 domain-containing protein [Halarchaeum sp. CBA1220]QLC32904.1 DUF106 domain-containing protein [Halarchaeum sp. CBA1220]